MIHTEKKSSVSAASLREKAEEQFKKNHSAGSVPLTEFAALRLNHELEVHQIELEMQNEELKRAKDLAEKAAEKFTALYDFAPVGYFTLGRDSTIKGLNLMGASLLGKERSLLVNSNFKLFVTRDTLIVFDDFISKIFETHFKQSCEARLTIKGNPSVFVQLEGIVSENTQECLLTAIDITNRKLVEELLNNHNLNLEETVKKLLIL